MSLARRSDIEDFADDLREALGDRVEEVVLFGSYATDEYVPGSDIDIAVIVSRVEGGDDERVWDIAEDYRSQKDLNFSPKLFEKREFEEKLEKGFSFYREVREQGVEV